MHYIPLFLLLVPTLLVAGTPIRIDTTFRMSDDVTIAASLFLPDAEVPADGFPAIISVHGFGGSRQSFASRALEHADSGYVAITFSVRGQGRGGDPNDVSGGVTDWIDDDRIVEDVHELILALGSRADVNAERIGLEGGSQGGRVTWASLIERLPVACGLTVIASPYNREAFANNDLLNYFMAWALLTARSGNLVAFGPFLDSLYRAYELGGYGEVLRLTDGRDRSDRLDRIDVPVFTIVTWQDELFPVAPLLREYDDLGFPRKLLVIPGGHSNARMPELQRDLTYRFYGEWLKDESGRTVMQSDSAVVLVDPATSDILSFSVNRLDEFLPGGGSTDSVDFFFHAGGRLLEVEANNPISISRFYLQNVTDESVTFRSEPFDRPVQIIGGEISFTGSSTAPVWQTNVLLWDHDTAAGTWRPVTRGAWGARDGGAERDVTYDLDLTLYTLQPGHVLEARIRFGLPVLLPAHEFGWAPTPPSASGTTTFSGTPDNAARLRLYTVRQETTEVQNTTPFAPILDLSTTD